MHDRRAIGVRVCAAVACAAFAVPGAAAPPLADVPGPAAAAAGGYVVLRALYVADGNAPLGELVQGPNGALYGTTYTNGSASGGTVFQIQPSGKFSVLHSFVITDGQAPAGGLTLGADGALYGLTGGGGDYGGGTAFRLTLAGAFTLLHSFGGPAGDGAYPYLGALAQAADGNFYGTTMQGGAHGLGVAFRMTPTGAVTVLHTFAGGSNDGGSPRGQLIASSDGLLRGITSCGGVPDASAGCGGLLFTLGTSGAFSIVHRFSPADAPQGPLMEHAGFVYGTTSAGGAARAGTVFKAALDGSSFVSWHEFAPSALGAKRTAEGARPIGKLLFASDGNFYGTTANGGLHALTDPNGDGTIFRIAPDGKYTVIQSFGATTNDGARPYGGLVQGRDGYLYGTTHDGSAQANGTIFRLPLPAAP